MSVEYSRRLFSVAEFNQLVEAGFFDQDDRLELIEGEIIEMSPIGERHAASVRKLTTRLVRLLGDKSLVSVQNPVITSAYSEPQPDIALLVPRNDYYSRTHPRSRNIQVLIEVADTTLEFDLKVKTPLYGKAGIREVWVIDLNGEQVYQHTALRAGQYRVTVIHKAGSTFQSKQFPGVEFRVSDFLS